jgi:dihydropteroate synthase
MGILNITPDSFYDGGKYENEKSQLQRVEKMLKEDADFIDIGAQSTRPGAKEIGFEQELQLLSPTISSIRKYFPEAIISIDTWYSKVAKTAHSLGADMINDISGGTFDKEMFNTINEIQIPYILMHTGGKPSNMQDNPQYDNILKEVIFFMSEQIDKLNHIGVNDIIIDPGFGFGKTLEHNYELLKDLNHFSFLDVPLLVGISRKSMIYKPLNISPEEALNGTTALHFKALEGGANILRVHDVKEAKECIDLYLKLN